MSNKKKLKSVVRIKKRPPRPDLAHLEKQEREAKRKPTIRKVSVASRPVAKTPAATLAEVEKNPVVTQPPVIESAAVPVDASASSVSVPETAVENVPAGVSPDETEVQPETTDAIIQTNLRRLSLAELQRYAKQTAKGADNAIVEHAELAAALDMKLDEIKRTKTPKDASDEQRADFNAKRAQLRKERDAIVRKKTIACENAVALERAADEYAAIVALLLDQPEVDYRKQPRLNEKNVSLTEEEKLELIERMLASGRFSKQEAVAPTPKVEAPRPVAKAAAGKPIEEVKETKEATSRPVVLEPSANPPAGAGGNGNGTGSSGGPKRGRLYALLALLGCIILVLVVFLATRKGGSDVVQNAASGPTVATMSSGTAGSAQTAADPVVQDAVGTVSAESAYPMVVDHVEEEPVVPAVVAEAPALTEIPVERSVGYMGYSIDVAAYDGYAQVKYPSFITAEEIAGFMAHESEAYRDELSDVTYAMEAPGILRIDYPGGLAVGDRNYAIDQLSKDIIAYVEDFLAASEPPAAATSEAAPAYVEPVHPIATVSVEPPQSAKTITGTTFSVRMVASVGSSAPAEDMEDLSLEFIDPLLHRVIGTWPGDSFVEVDVYDGHAEVQYPSIVSEAEIDAAVGMLVSAYPGYLDGVSYQVPVDGLMEVSFPVGIPVDELGQYLDLIESEVLWYLDYRAGLEPLIVPTSSEGTVMKTSTLKLVAYISDEASVSESLDAGVEAPVAMQAVPTVVVATAVPPIAPVPATGAVSSRNLFSVWGVPYSLKTVNHVGTNSAFVSAYGAGAGVSYDYLFSNGLTLGLESGFLWHRIDSASYYEIPVLARIGYRFEGPKWSWGLSLGVGGVAGMYEGTNQFELLGSASVDVERRLTERLGLALRVNALVSGPSLLPNYMSDTIVSFSLPVSLGLTFRF